MQKVFLIYPRWGKFDQSFSFEFDESLQLGVVPFPIDDDKITDFIPHHNDEWTEIEASPAVGYRQG